MSRIPLFVAVVGALLIGGATAGSTRASWSEQVPMAGDGITAGRLSYTASTPSGVTVDKVNGSTADTTFVLDDTSLGKNIAQRITATVVATPAGTSATVGRTCPGASASASVDTTPTSPDQTVCVRVTSSTTAVNGNVTINITSAQRPTAGWTTPTITRSLMVTVNAPVSAPAAPALTCQVRSGSFVSFTWPTVAGVTYTVHQATTDADASYSSGSTPSGSGIHTVMPVTGSTTFYRVKATNAGGTSGFSNTVRVVRPGGPNTISCSPVTP